MLHYRRAMTIMYYFSSEEFRIENWPFENNKKEGLWLKKA